MKQGRDTTQEERVQIVKDCLASGKNYGEMALKYKVSYQQVRTWTLRFEEMGETGLEDRRGKRKKDQVPRTELEKAQIEIEQLMCLASATITHWFSRPSTRLCRPIRTRIRCSTATEGSSTPTAHFTTSLCKRV